MYCLQMGLVLTCSFLMVEFVYGVVTGSVMQLLTLFNAIDSVGEGGIAQNARTD